MAGTLRPPADASSTDATSHIGGDADGTPVRTHSLVTNALVQPASFSLPHTHVHTPPVAGSYVHAPAPAMAGAPYGPGHTVLTAHSTSRVDAALSAQTPAAPQALAPSLAPMSTHAPMSTQAPISYGTPPATWWACHAAHLQQGPYASVVRSQRGDYLVGRVVGAGSFGTVYECFGPFDQRYALKVLPASADYFALQRERWSNEVQRLLRLRHPNVVYIHDAFVWENSFCVALEWCDHTLSDMLTHPLGEELAIELFRQMLAAVQYLHDSDLVHDDLHPGNVLIQQADRPIVKISDFGISTELRGAQAVRPEVVHHAIMAPELIAAGYTSKQSDLYQLGMIMYWVLTATPPIDWNVPYPQLVAQITDGMARQRAEQLPGPLGAIVTKMLRRREAYRYSSAREVWADLRQVPAWQSRQLFHVR